MLTRRPRHTGPKVFGIGFQKTATSSLGLALEHLGLKVSAGFAIRDTPARAELRHFALRRANRHDAVQDNPWPLFYRDLDAAFPGSKFVLTTRPADAWIGSVVRHFGADHSPMRQLIYGAGSPVGNEDVYLARYVAHNAEVLEYFSDRPADLLHVDLGEGPLSWKPLCALLDLPVPDQEMPHANDRASREASRPSTARRARRYLERQRW